MCSNARKISFTWRILFQKLAYWRKTPGGYALAYIFDQIGHIFPNFHNVLDFKRIIISVQKLFEESIFSAGHDISGGV